MAGGAPDPTVPSRLAATRPCAPTPAAGLCLMQAGFAEEQGLLGTDKDGPQALGWGPWDRRRSAQEALLWMVVRARGNF